MTALFKYPISKQSFLSVVIGCHGDAEEAEHTHLDDQVNAALVVVAGHRRVRTHHQLPVDLSRQVNVLPWKKRRAKQSRSS